MKMKPLKQALTLIQTQQQLLNDVPVIDRNESTRNTNVNTVLAQSQNETKEKNDTLNEQNIKIEEEIRTGKQELSNLICETGSNLEYKMKLNALATVAVTYGLIAVTVPLLVKFFGTE